MTRPDWDTYFMKIADAVSLRMSCDRARIGAVITSPEHFILTTGYGGAPSGWPSCDEVGHELMEINGRQSCVTGDTVISKFQTGHYNTGHRTIETIFQQWCDPRQRGAMRRMRIRSVNDDGAIVPGAITDVWMVGERDVFRVTTRLGRTVVTTADHLFRTPTGWRPLNSLAPGESVALNGQYAHEDPEWLRKRYEAGATVERIAKLCNVSTSSIQRRMIKFGIPRRPRPDWTKGGGPGAGWNRAMIREDSHTYKGREVNSSVARSRARRYALADHCAVCGHVRDLQVHHQDGDEFNDELSNLITLCVSCHNVGHTPHAKIKTIVFDVIITIESVGRQTVYDLTTEPHHNFVGNGVILHNCVRTVHAEENAIVTAARHGVRLDAGTLYTTASTCYDCAKMAAQAGIKRIVYGAQYNSARSGSTDIIELMRSRGVEMVHLPITLAGDPAAQLDVLVADAARRYDIVARQRDTALRDLETSQRFLEAESAANIRHGERNTKALELLGIKYPGLCNDRVWGGGIVEGIEELKIQLDAAKIGIRDALKLMENYDYRALVGDAEADVMDETYDRLTTLAGVVKQ